MKTVELAGGGAPERVKDAQAKEMVRRGTHTYCKKDVWKYEVRDSASRVEREAEQKRKDEAKAKRDAEKQKGGKK